MSHLLAAIRRAFRRPRPRDLEVLLQIWLLSLLAATVASLLLASRAAAAELSPGDSLRVLITDGEEFAGDYQLDTNGSLVLPLLGPIRMAGLSREQAQARIAERLVGDGYFQQDYLDLTLLVLDWAPVQITVAGAVYFPGVIQVHLPDPRKADLNAPAPMPGAQRPRRYLSDAIRAAGGVRPDASLAAVKLIRNGSEQTHDLRGYFTGAPVPEILLVNGDRVVIAASGRDDPTLFRKSLISPPGIKIFASNLITPANNNAAASVPSSGISLPYGARFSQAVVAANCAGGIGATHAARHAVLVRTDRLTGATRHWRSSIRNLLIAQDGNDNPFVLEGDALYCLDSGVTNIRDIFRTATDILLPFKLRRYP